MYVCMDGWMDRYMDARAHPRGAAGLQPPPQGPPKPKFKKHIFCRHDDIKVLRDLPFSRNSH
jgi:hypothetical protein